MRRKTLRSAPEPDGTEYPSRNVSRFWVTLLVRPEGRKTAWKKECKMQTRPDGGDPKTNRSNDVPWRVKCKQKGGKCLK